VAQQTRRESGGHAKTVSDVLRWLERRGTERNRDGMARFAICSAKRFGVSMATMDRWFGSSDTTTSWRWRSGTPDGWRPAFWLRSWLIRCA